MKMTTNVLKRSVLKYAGFASLVAVFFLDGCGYTTSSLLPSDLKTIYVENVVSKINVTAEQTNLRMYRGYRPGMEVTLTKAIIDRYMFDGNLKIAPEGKADLMLRTDLIDFKRDALRYDSDDNVQEYRIKLIVNMDLINMKTGNVEWKERGFAGETTYVVTGSRAMTEDQALDDAIADLARRIVERTIEAW